MKILLVQVVTWLLGLVHPRVAPVVTWPVAFALWHISRRLRTVSLKNLELCYPQLPVAERRRLARRAMGHYVRNIFEAGIAWHWSRERFDKLFEPDAGRNHFDTALAAGRGVIVLAPHHGSWELMGLRVTQEVGGAILYKPGDDAELEARLVQSRERFGTTMLPANRKGLKGLFDFLARGEVTGILPDQEPTTGDGRFAPFFGVPALTGVLACRLLRRTGANPVFGVCIRRPRGHYRIHFVPAEPEVQAEDLDVALAALNRGIERCIEIAPEQYLWGYKRFRQRPDNEPRFY